MAKAIDWLKANYDRAMLMAAAVFLFICAIAIWWGAIQFNNRLITPPTVPPKTASQPPLQNTEVHAPVPNEWFEKYALPIEDADALEQDPDKDGFTNLDEWQGNTDPTKAESHPDYTTKLRLVSATEEPFRYIFASRTKDKFGINSTDESEPTQFLKVGDIIRGTDFKILKFTEKKERNQYGMKMDVSELLLEHQQNHAQLTLVKGQVATSPQSVATFVYSWGGRKEFEVRKDQEFPLATAEGNRTYKLIDVRPDKAVIVNAQNPGAPIEIGFGNP